MVCVWNSQSQIMKGGLRPADGRRYILVLPKHLIDLVVPVRGLFILADSVWGRYDDGTYLKIINDNNKDSFEPFVPDGTLKMADKNNHLNDPWPVSLAEETRDKSRDRLSRGRASQ